MRSEGKWEVYESDILFRNRFLIDRGLGGMVWISAEGKPVNPTLYLRVGYAGNSFCENYACDSAVLASGLKKIESLRIAPLKYLSFDIECLPLDGGMPSPDISPIIMISFSFEPPYKSIKL